MTTKSKILASVVAVLVVGIGAFLRLNPSGNFTGGNGEVADPIAVSGGHDRAVAAPTVAAGHSEAVDRLIARNVAARGGADAWRSVNTLQLTGTMDIGHGMHVPYVMEQKRPGKACLEFKFDAATATQCVDGTTGWKRFPFMGHTSPKPMTEKEVNEMAGATALDGLLFDSHERGYKVALIGPETVDGKHTSKLKVTLPGGVVRWVYLDEETGLEVKIQAMRALRGRERLVETYYSNWQTVDGLLISHRQETRYEGDKESHFVTVDGVRVNQPLDDLRFAKQTAGGSDRGLAQEASS